MLTYIIMRNLKMMHTKVYENGAKDGKHYWLTPPDVFKKLDDEFHFNFDPCPYPKPKEFNGLTCEWGISNYVNPPFGAYVGEDGKKYGPTAWARKAIEENKKGKTVVFIYPMHKWMLEMIDAGCIIKNAGKVIWLSIEDNTPNKGSDNHALFILKGDEE
jgi:hypothetical protein